MLLSSHMKVCIFKTEFNRNWDHRRKGQELSYFSLYHKIYI